MAQYSFTHQYTLDKPYFTECYDQSVTPDKSFRAYAKAIFFTLFGGLLVVFTQINPYAAWFIFAIGILEWLSGYYQRPWWITRQMFSKAATSKVTLTIDDKGIASESFYQKQMFTWQEIELTSTEKGWIITHKQGRNYIASKGMEQPLIDFLNSHLVL